MKIFKHFAIVFISCMLYIIQDADARDTFPRVQGNPSFPGGFYGSDNGQTAGPLAFQKVLNLHYNLNQQVPYTDSDRRPMMLLIYGQDSCSSDCYCDKFVSMYFEYSRSGSQSLLAPFINGYFRGSDIASCEAKNFFVNTLKNNGNCHLIGFYGVAGDGSAYTYSTSLSDAITWDGYKKLIENQNTAWFNFKKNRPYIQIDDDVSITRLIVYGDPPDPSKGSFYGYKNNFVSPGDDAFTKMYNTAMLKHNLLIVYFGKDKCHSCNALATDFNLPDNNVLAGNMLKYKNSYNAHFRGSDSNSAKAWLDAYAIDTDGDPTLPTPSFYGYRNTIDGPGDDAFQKCLDLCENTRFSYYDKEQKKDIGKDSRVKRPMIVIVGEDNCATCSAFCQSGNDAVSSFTSCIRAFYMVSAYFRGNTQACRDAKTFFTTHLGVQESETKCHRLGLYGVFEDGTKMIQSVILPTKVAEFQKIVMNWKSQWEQEYSKHLFNPFANPHFIGEKDFYTFGEWTLDLNLALNCQQNFTLVVIGCSTVNDKLQAYAAQVFSTEIFNSLAVNNKMSLVLLDRIDSLGNGLLTHNHVSDHCYISTKGLRTYSSTYIPRGCNVFFSVEEMQEQIDDNIKKYSTKSSNEMEIILLCQNGSVVGRLSPSITWNSTTQQWMCDLNENISRIEELIKNAQ